MSVAGSALLLTGGHSHPPDLSLGALTDLLAGVGLAPVVVEDPEGALAGLTDSDHDLLVVNALRWTMGHPRYAEFRDDWALSLSADARRQLAGWVGSGRPLLALHSAIVSFDDWPEWIDLIGGVWDWSCSSHPPVGPVEVAYPPGVALTADLADFTVHDECYVDLNLHPDVDVVATMTADGCGGPQPACWVLSSGGRRVATSALGHDRRSLDHPAHRALLERLVQWLLSDDPVTA